MEPKSCRCPLAAVNTWNQINYQCTCYLPMHVNKKKQYLPKECLSRFKMALDDRWWWHAKVSPYGCAEEKEVAIRQRRAALRDVLADVCSNCLVGFRAQGFQSNRLVFGIKKVEYFARMIKIDVQWSHWFRMVREVTKVLSFGWTRNLSKFFCIIYIVVPFLVLFEL